MSDAVGEASAARSDRGLGATPQETYELLRPIVLFGCTPAERARETGVAERTLRRTPRHIIGDTGV